MENNNRLEEDLLNRARNLERPALAQIYDLYSPGLYRYAYRLLGDPDLAEECVAETFSRFLHALHQHKGPRHHLQAYLYRVAHNWITDGYRRSPPPPEELKDDYPSAEGTPEELVAQDIRQRRIRAALHTLTPDQRYVIAMKFLEGCDNEAIAQSLRKPIGAIKSLQHRGLARLKKVLLDEASHETKD